MTKSDHLVAYIEGVKNGDGETILQSLSDSFVLDDPDKGQISKDGPFAMATPRNAESGTTDQATLMAG